MNICSIFAKYYIFLEQLQKTSPGCGRLWTTGRKAARTTAPAEKARKGIIFCACCCGLGDVWLPPDQNFGLYFPLKPKPTWQCVLSNDNAGIHYGKWCLILRRIEDRILRIADGKDWGDAICGCFMRHQSFSETTPVSSQLINYLRDIDLDGF